MQFDVDITKQLPGFRLATRFSCEASTVVLFGPSGAGKSLTLQGLAGILKPDRGRIVIDGQVLYDSDQKIAVAPRDRQIGYVPQSYALFPHMSVEDNIAFGLRRQTGSEAKNRVSDLIEMFGLIGFEKRRPKELSGGQQQRVALARALAIKPRVLLLDEPFTALDVAIRDVLTADLRRVRDELGVGIVLVTHGIVDTYALADTVVIYQNGQVLQVGRPDNVFRHPAAADVARLTGARNVLTGVVVDVSHNGCCVEVHGVRLQTSTTGIPAGEPAVITIRPEDAHLVAAEDAVTDEDSVIPCTIRSVVLQGHLYGVDVSLNSTSESLIHVLVPVWWWQRHRLVVGSNTHLAIASASVNVLGSESLPSKEGAEACLQGNALSL